MNTEELVATTEVARNAKGQFPEGVSGNPAGRPLSTRNKITNLKQSLEVAIRENVKAEEIIAIIQTMTLLAIGGNVGAGKLILDKVMSNAKVEEDTETGDKKITIYVKNATFGAPDIEPEVIEIKDVTPEE